MSRAQKSRLMHSARLLNALKGRDQFVIVTHDNPDPDAIATGWGVQVLIEEKLNKPVRLVGGGAIVRAENRHMVELLQPPIELVDDIEISESAATILVDCSSAATNHLLMRKAVRPVAVIDHHPGNKNGARPDYRDIRPKVAASASIAASYLREQKIHPGMKLATAMLYAIRTETRGFETYHSALDRAILPWLTERSEPALLADIENAPLAREYFSDLVLAIQNTFIYGDVAFCYLPRAAGADIVGEVADLLIRCQAIRRVLCAAVVGHDLLLSARTAKQSGSAVELLQHALERFGGAGGHAHRAGGKIPHVGAGGKIDEGVQDKLRRRWLDACGATRRRGTRLVAKREIVENL